MKESRLWDPTRDAIWKRYSHGAYVTKRWPGRILLRTFIAEGGVNALAYVYVSYGVAAGVIIW